MPYSSIVNKATGQVCRPAEKKPVGKKLCNINQNGIDYCKLDMYLHFIRSNMAAKYGSNVGFFSISITSQLLSSMYC